MDKWLSIREREREREREGGREERERERGEGGGRGGERERENYFWKSNFIERIYLFYLILQYFNKYE